MPVLTIRNRLPAREMCILSIDGVPQAETTLTVPETFCLRLEQYRLSSSQKDTAEVLGTILTVLTAGGRASWGNEAASPYYAVWEGTCQMSRDGEIELWLHEEGCEVNFVPWSDTVSFQVTESRTGGRDPAKVGRWALMIAPPLIFVSAVCLFLIFAVGIFGPDPSQDAFLWVPRLTFLILPLYMLFHIWEGVLRPFLRKKKTDWELRISRQLTVQIVVVVLLAGAAVFEILSFWVFNFEPAMFTIFPATVVLIAHLIAVSDSLDQAERSGKRTETLESKLRWSSRLRIAACGIVAVILLALVLKMAV